MKSLRVVNNMCPLVVNDIYILIEYDIFHYIIFTNIYGRMDMAMVFKDRGSPSKTRSLIYLSSMIRRNVTPHKHFSSESVPLLYSETCL